MTEEEVRAEVGTKAIKFIDEHEKDCLTGFEMMRDFAYEVTKELEKENAELREKLKPENCITLLAKEGYIKFTSEQLTKAKELLKRFVELENCTLDYDDIKEAEQFLSEVEK